MKNDFAGESPNSPEITNQEITDDCQKKKTGNSYSVTVLHNTFHKKDYRSDDRHKQVIRSTRRCHTCGVLCASNSWETHVHFCKIENGVKIIKEKLHPAMRKILKNKIRGEL